MDFNRSLLAPGPSECSWEVKKLQAEAVSYWWIPPYKRKVRHDMMAHQHSGHIQEEMDTGDCHGSQEEKGQRPSKSTEKTCLRKTQYNKAAHLQAENKLYFWNTSVDSWNLLLLAPIHKRVNSSIHSKSCKQWTNSNTCWVNLHTCWNSYYKRPCQGITLCSKALNPILEFWC